MAQAQAIPFTRHAFADGSFKKMLIDGKWVAAASGKRLVFYCAFGERSAMAVQAAQDAGLKTACHIAGGIDAWKKASGPLGQ